MPCLVSFHFKGNHISKGFIDNFFFKSKSIIWLSFTKSIAFSCIFQVGQFKWPFVSLSFYLFTKRFFTLVAKGCNNVGVEFQLNIYNTNRIGDITVTENPSYEGYKKLKRQLKCQNKHNKSQLGR